MIRMSCLDVGMVVGVESVGSSVLWRRNQYFLAQSSIATRLIHHLPIVKFYCLAQDIHHLSGSERYREQNSKLKPTQPENSLAGANVALPSIKVHVCITSPFFAL